MKRAQHAAHNPKFEKMGKCRVRVNSQGRVHNRALLVLMQENKGLEYSKELAYIFAGLQL